MSQANVDYILKHNSEIKKEKVEICPNSVEVIDRSVSDKEKQAIRKKYGVPNDRIVFVYGGNLGKPQGIDFLIECLKKEKDNQNIFFLIVGSGTEYRKIEDFIKKDALENVMLLKQLPKEDYDKMVGSCDVGMIFLDHRFTIPNFPSRLLSYMQAKIPVLAVTDPNTDIGKVIVEGGFGWWCESAREEELITVIMNILETWEHDKKLIKSMGERAKSYLESYYEVSLTYNRMIESLKRV